MNSHKRDEYKRKLAEQKQEIAGLRAHVDNLMKHLEYTTTVEMCADETGYIQDEGFVNRELIFERAAEALMTTPTQSLQQIKRDAVLEAVDKSLNKCASWIIESDEVGLFVEELDIQANNLVKDGE